MYDQKLETLLIVADLKSYTEAAKVLHLTQPAVSQHIQALEKEHNIKIFNRTGNDLVPTRLGEILIKYARRTLNLYKDVCIKIEEEKHQVQELKIGVTHSSEGNVIPEVLVSLTAKNPTTTIKIFSDDIRKLYDKLSTYEIDLAIVEGKVTNEKFSTILLDTDSIVAVVSKNNVLAKKESVTIDEIKHQKLILRSDKSATRNLLENKLKNIDLSMDDFNVIFEIDNTSVIKELVKKDLGVSILPKSVCFNEIKDKSLVVLPIQDLNMVTELNLVFLKNYTERYILDDLVYLYKNAIELNK